MDAARPAAPGSVRRFDTTLAPAARMTSLLRDLRQGTRLLMRHPGATATALCTLMIGIGAGTAIFSVVNAVLLRPLPYPDPEQLRR